MTLPRGTPRKGRKAVVWLVAVLAVGALGYFTVASRIAGNSKTTNNLTGPVGVSTASASAGGGTVIAGGAACKSAHPVIVLDPGHSGGTSIEANTAEVDSRTAVKAALPGTNTVITYKPVYITGSGIRATDNGGADGELNAMWVAADAIQKTLRAHGYLVYLTKHTEGEQVGLLTRVQRAESHHPALAVSLHYSGPDGSFTALFGHPYPSYGVGVTPQVWGEYRTNKADGATVRFTNRKLADESQRIAHIMLNARNAVGDHQAIARIDFPRPRPLAAYGNISIVQVLDQQFPWIYMEEGSVHYNGTVYAAGIANGIMRAVPIKKCTSATAQPASSASPAGSLPALASGVIVEPPDSQLPPEHVQAFIAQVVSFAKVAQQRYHIPASVIIAQAIIESRSGTSLLATEAHNLFGVKCHAGDAPSCVRYKPRTEKEGLYDAYPDWQTSVMSYAHRLATYSAYAAARAHEGDPDAFAKALSGVYATAGGYGAHVIADMKLYKLYQYN